jgi:hypothetical protein
MSITKEYNTDLLRRGNWALGSNPCLHPALVPMPIMPGGPKVLHTTFSKRIRAVGLDLHAIDQDWSGMNRGAVR